MNRAVLLAEPGIMPRRELVERQAGFPCQLRQHAELHEGVAPHARIRRPSGEVFRAEIIQHDLLVFVRAVEHAVFDPELAAQGFRVRDVLRLAGPETRILVATLVTPLAPQFHGDADDLVPLFPEQSRRDRGIDAAGKSHGDLHGRISSMRSMGAFAFWRSVSSSSIRGSRSRRANSTSSSVIRFIFGQSTSGSSG